LIQTNLLKGKQMSRSMVGILLIVLGVLALAYQGFTYTKREKAVDAGPIQISVDREKTVPIPPIIGALALAGGIVLLLTSKRN
jgi:hypothetical protein